MRQFLFVLGGIGAAILLAAVAGQPIRAEDKPSGNGKTALSAAFDRLQGLVGEWEEQTPKDPAAKGKTVVQYRTTGGGTALTETIFPGSNMEMLSVYHRDGDQLVMTHFCCVGNQPRFRAKIGKTKDELVFEFVGGANIDPAKDMHIHGGLIRFVDADHAHAEWYAHSDGKQSETYAFDLVRKKK
jgi:hypothetical protein